MAETKGDIKGELLEKLRKLRLKELLDGYRELSEAFGYNTLVDEVLAKEFKLQIPHVIFSNIDGDFIQSISEKVMTLSGMYPHVFIKDVKELNSDGLYTFVLHDQPQITFRPKLFMVSSDSIDGELLGLRVCNYSVISSSIPLSVFAPITWANPKLMAEAMLDFPTVTPANRIEMLIRVNRPMRFTALLLGPYLNEKSVYSDFRFVK